MTRCRSRNPKNQGRTRCYLAKNHNGPHKDRQRAEWKGDGFWWFLVEDLIDGWNVIMQEKEPEPQGTFTITHGPPRGR